MDFNDNDFNMSDQQDQENYQFKGANSMDRNKIFWLFILSTLVITFVFIFGYWFGEQKSSSKYLKLVSNNVITPPEKTLSSENSALANDMGNTKTNNSEQPSSLPNSSSKEEENNITQQDLSNLDQANQTVANKVSPDQSNSYSSPDLNTNYNTHSSKKVNIKKLHSNSPLPKYKKQSSRSKTKSASSKTYIVQLATFQSEKNAINLRNKLKKHGFYNAFTLKKGVLYRVRLGRFSSYSDAKTKGEAAKKIAGTHNILILNMK